MTTDGFLKINETSLKTQALKEATFDAASFPVSLRDAEECLKNPSITTTYSIPSPSLSSFRGIQIGSRTARTGAPVKVGIFSETAHMPNTAGYYFPLGSELSGRSFSDISNSLSKPVPVLNRVPNILGEFVPEANLACINKPVFIYSEGAAPSKSTLINLLNLSARNTAWNINATTSSLEKNIVSAPDGLNINATNLSLDTKGIYKITPTTTGYYSFSFYARIPGRDYYSNNIRYLRISISPSVVNSFTIAPIDGYSPSDRYVFDIKFEWRRYAAVFYLEANQEYTITLNWFAKDISVDTRDNYRTSGLRICGVFLEKAATPSIYDYQYSNKPLPSKTTYYPLVFDAVDLPIFANDVDSWTIAYRRKIFDNPASGTMHCDSLGDLYWGYRGSVIIANNFNSEGIDSVDVASFFNTWEVVVLQHKSNSDLVSVTVDAADTDLSYSFNINTQGIDFTQTLQGQRYNLMLGAKKDILGDFSSSTYKDVIITADDSDELVQRLRNVLLKVTEGSATIVEPSGSTTVSDAIIATNTNFIEKANLEY